MPGTLRHLCQASHWTASLRLAGKCCSVVRTRDRHTSAASMQQANGVEIERHFYNHGLKSLSPGLDVKAILARISNPREAPLGNSAFVKPKSLIYELDGRTRKWDIIESHASVGIIIYHKDLDSFMLVRQWRPAVYAAACREAVAKGEQPPPLAVGFTHELCAGIIDKAKGMHEICSEEILEECGYAVSPDGIKEVTSFLSATGTSGSAHVLFYSEVEESQKVSNGGGMAESGECIEVLALPVDNAEAFVMDTSMGKSPGMMFGLLWASTQFKAGKLKRSGHNGGLETGELVLGSVVPS